MCDIKLRKSKLAADEIKVLYTDKYLTMDDIAMQAGISKQAVRLILNRLGVAYRGGKVKKKCLYCGCEFDANRYKIKKGQGSYCSVQCSHSDRSLGGDMTVSSHMGRAAWISSGREIQKGQVIHHIDGNRQNNELSNLMLFNTQKEHMQFHHALRGTKRKTTCG